MAALGPPTWGSGVWATTVWAAGVWNGGGGSTDPFGNVRDLRYTAFGTRVRRTAALLVLFLTLIGTG